MGMQINTNMAALNASRVLNRTNNNLNQSMERLSSGLRINRAADDAAGLTIAENFNSVVKGTSMAQTNAQDGVNMIQTAEGDLSEITNMLQRMRELAVKGASGTQNLESSKALNDEFQELKAQITDIASESQFNGISLLDDTAGDVTLQVGSQIDQTLDVTFGDAQATAIGEVTAADVDGVNNDVASLDDAILINDEAAGTYDAGDTQEDAVEAIASIDQALNDINDLRSGLGASQNRLEFTMNTLAIEQENAASSESAIRDADMAQESMNFTRNQILQQGGTSMLAQANMVPQTALQLLG